MSMDLSKIEELYSKNIDEFGLDAKSVGWGTQEKQDLRFKKLLGVIEDKSEKFSVNELGCGYGELVKYCERNEFNLQQYHGYDISEKMLTAAKEYITGDNIHLHHASKLETKEDYAIASGIFNVRFKETEEAWEKFVKETITHMYESSNKGIAINFLTKYVDWEAEDLYYADPALYLDFCKKELSKYINVIHDYNLYEFTITVIKE
jgi:SAM-dependent methyltransferase